MDRSNAPVGSVETLLSLVEYLEQSGEAGVTEIADAVGVSKSTAHNHLTTLEQQGYVVGEDGQYWLSLQFLRIGETTRMRTGLFEVARPQIEHLVEGTDLVGNLAVEERGDGVYLYRSRGSDDIRFSTRAGETHDLHCSATGKSILAHVSTERREELLDSIDLVGYTDQTITERAALREELDRIHERGVAFDEEEYGRGLRCVGVPLFGPDDAVVGAISLSGPAAEMTDDWYRETLPDRLRAAKNRVEVNLRDY
ncbi:transcriptional regulator, IclR family [Natronoarchaeum philippinense]|uniref:Transcriptional regulator, IclR family n=1 Tax=Natronoarchaeum philippinense TaxID=558529 RepID=A0A285P567_NATPI|nr:IclR family transcriptional regulator [Natronoarchaeum philippinense]SNZ16864.1 transcriptional regulator, IclR family [Natronoarchaeum philippinense]